MAEELPHLTDWPILFLPVNVEARFGTEAQNPVLHIRVYPDAVHVDSHEPGLTADEKLALERWRAVSSAASTDAEGIAAWTALAERFGPARASWLVREDRASAPDRDRAWTRAPLAAALPDRWIATGYIRSADGTLQKVFSQAGLPVDRDLAVGPAPKAGEQKPDDQLTVDEGMRWMIELAEARRRGMALTVQLDAAQSAGIDLLIVTGVRGESTATDAASALATESAALVERLFDAHHHTDGIELLAAGTATNNVVGTPSPWTSRDRDYVSSFATELGARLAATGSEGAELARALGIRSTIFDHVRGADAQRAAYERRARAMRALLWPATTGYALDQLRNGVIPDDDSLIDAIHRLFVERVQPRGPWGALRIGKQPYGVIPVTSLDRWQPFADEDPALARIHDLALRMRSVWRDSVAHVSKVGIGDPGEALVGILATSPASTALEGRSALGPVYASYLWRFIEHSRAGALDDAWWNRQRTIAAKAFEALRLDWRSATTSRRVFAAQSFPIDGHVIGPATDAELEWLATNGWNALAAQTASPGGPTSLLWLVSRRSALQAYAFALHRDERRRGATVDRNEPEMIDRSGATTGTAQRTVFDKLGDVVDSIAVGERLDRDRLTSNETPELRELYAALPELRGTDATTLEALLRETFDLSAHRLDAWLTAYSTSRLDRLRSHAPGPGVYIGGYGWLEQVRPRPAQVVATPAGEEGEIHASTRPGGYIHAPSLGHAVTAAVLRSGHLSHGAGDGALAIDLRSARVRVARWLLEGVRQGRSLGAMLGYRLQRTLVDAEPSQGHLIPVLRELAPLSVGPGIDGVLLLRKWGTELRAGENGLPAATHPAWEVLAEAVAALDDAVDAIADLTTAEAVHQMTSGNTAAAAAIADAISHAGPIPAELAIATTPLPAAVITHRLVVVLDGSAPAQEPGWSKTPRAVAEPWLEAWAERLLGDPKRVVGRIATEGTTTTQEVTLASLDLAALDLIFADDVAAELRARCIDHVVHGEVTVRAQFVEGRNPAWPPDKLSIEEVALAARSVRDLLSSARQLEARDLAHPTIAAESEFDPDDVADAERRLPIDDIESTIADLGANERPRVRRGLLMASLLGVTGSIPSPDPARWPTQAVAVRDELVARKRRVAELARERTPTSAARLAKVHAQLLAWFGGAMRALPRFKPPEAFKAALPSSIQVQDNDPLAVVAWLKQIARVRASAWRMERAIGFAELFADGSYDPALNLRVAEVTPAGVDRPARWIGLDAVEGSVAGRVSIVAETTKATLRAGSISGLFVDAWTEAIPDRTTSTGLAFQHDAPDARAPQALLLAVPPQPTPRWSWADIEAILLETFDAARMRAVDPRALQQLGQHLPCLWFPVNVQGEAISTDFTLARGTTP